MMIKPCWNCTQVQDPANCDDSSCLRWQQWFAHTWDDMRHSLRVDMENRPKDLCRIPCRMKRQWLSTKTLLQ